jgi:hypothetical protein
MSTPMSLPKKVLSRARHHREDGKEALGVQGEAAAEEGGIELRGHRDVVKAVAGEAAHDNLPQQRHAGVGKRPEVVALDVEARKIVL